MMSGMNPTLLELLIAVVAMDRTHIMTSVQDIAVYLKLDPGVTNSIVDLMMCEFNSKNEQKQSSFG